MDVLLDTHVFLWYISADHRMPNGWREILDDTDNTVYLSAVSVWEATIKHQLGKLPLPKNAPEYLAKARVAHGISALPLNEEDTRVLVSLPALHRDPFDRILICQALTHSLTLATVDSEMQQYEVETLRLS